MLAGPQTTKKKFFPTEFQAHIQEHPVLKAMANLCQALKIETYVVGGYVRDLLLQGPVKDLDFVCVGQGNGILLAEAFSKNYPESSAVTVFKSFGTAMLKWEGYELEFVGARKESYDRNSRKPAIEEGTIQDDQLRRDFTINALAISLNKENFGYLIDPFGGLADLADGIIRTPTDPLITFSDDPLRMLRAIRFAGRFGFDIEAETFAAIQTTASRLEIVSAERISTEFNKMLSVPKPSYGFKLLGESGLLPHFFPEFLALKGAENVEGRSHKDNFYHTLEVLDNVCVVSDNLWLRWAALLHDIGKPATKRYDPKVGFTFHGHEEVGARMVPQLFKRLKLPMGEPMRYVRKLVRMHLRPIPLSKNGVTDSAIRRIMVDAGEDLEDLLTLCRADVTTKNPNKARRYIENFGLVEKKMREVRDADTLRNFQPLLTGQHIMELLGLRPSPMVGKIKEVIRQEIIDGTLPNKIKPSVERMLQLAAEEGLQPVENFQDIVIAILEKIATQHAEAPSENS